MPTLHVLQGPDKGRTLTTSDEVVVLGRSDAPLGMTDQTVSRRHAEIKYADGTWVITDLNSANGTYLNGVRLQKPAKLKHGDQLRIGSTLLVFGGDESVEQISGAQIPHDLVRLDVGASIDASVVASVPSSEDSVIMAAPDTAYAVKSWKAMIDLSQAIGHLISADQLLPRVLDILFEEIETERGVIFIRDEQTNELLPEVVRYRSRESKDASGGEAIIASRTIMDHVVESREGVLSSNVVSDERFRSGKSVQNLGMRSVICAPIVAREQVLGVIHLDIPVTNRTYNEHELRLVTAIGYQTGLAIENARLMQAALERERLAAAGETVAYLTHSIKNILHGMRGGGDVLRKGLEKKDFELTGQGWGILDRNLDNCYRLMMNMLAFSKQREPYLETLQVNKVVNDAVNLVQKQADVARIVLLADLDETIPPIPTDYDGLHQVLMNLLTNAIDAVPKQSGIINVRTGLEPDGEHLRIIVADNGPGVPASERSKIFEPFHSTKGHRGTGLGLAVASKIVAELNGELSLQNPPDGGAEFIIRLPVNIEQTSPGETQGPRDRTRA